MRIALSTSVYGPGGMGRYVLELCRALEPWAGRHEFFFFAAEAHRTVFAPFEAWARVVWVPGSFHTPWADVLWHQCCLPGWVRRLKIDLWHVPSYRRLPHSAGCPSVATVHDLAPFHIPGKYGWARMLFARWWVPPVARRQERIVVPSACTRGDVLRWLRVNPQRVRLIPNGVDHARFHPGDRQEAAARVRSWWGMEKPFLLHVARLEHPAKGHLRVLEAFERFRSMTGLDWELVFAGPDARGASHVRRAVAASPARSAVRILGCVPEACLPDLYRAARALVFPSEVEGFGLPVLEAMACGSPVLATPSDAVSEVLGEGYPAMLRGGPNRWAEEIAVFAASETLGAQLSRAGLRRAACFSWQRTAEAMVALYEETAGDCGRLRKGGGVEGGGVCS